MPSTRKLPTKNIVHRTTVKTNNSVKQCIGATEGTIKQRIYNNKLSFSNRNYSTNTSLSTHIWHWKDINISPTITWEILKLAPTYIKTKKCLLCLHEKLAIITHPSQNTLLNKKSEILSKCRHENKHLISHFNPYT